MNYPGWNNDKYARPYDPAATKALNDAIFKKEEEARQKQAAAKKS